MKPRQAPPRVVTLPPTAFVDAWRGRPQGPYKVGLRRISADEQEFAKKEAVERADILFPNLAHDDQVWLETFDVILLHVTLSYVLVQPDDVQKPLWQRADGGSWVQLDMNTSEGLAAARNPSGVVVSTRFTKEGLGRLFDELNILSVLNNPLWPEIDDSDVEELGEELYTGMFFADLDAPARATETEEDVAARRAVSGQIRSLLGYVRTLREEGLIRPAPPVEAMRKRTGKAA